jgi:hypothetical protein
MRRETRELLRALGTNLAILAAILTFFGALAITKAAKNEFERPQISAARALER